MEVLITKQIKMENIHGLHEREASELTMFPLLDPSSGTNISAIHEVNKRASSALQKIEPGVEHAELEEKPSSSTATGESDDNIEQQQTGLEIGDVFSK